MNVKELADLFGVSKSWLYGLKKSFPAQVPKHKDDLEGWQRFISAHRIEATGGDRIPLSPRISRR